jgi:tetratricopeptide (TPR) repeat protein
LSGEINPQKFVPMKTINFSVLATFFPVLLYSQNDIWFQKGFDAEDPQEKIEYFTKSIELNRPAAACYYNRGDAKRSMQDYQCAISDYSKVIELDPKYVIAYQNIGIIYSTQDNHDAAIDVLEKAIRINADDPGLLDNLGYYYMEKGYYDKAIKRFKDCLKLENNMILLDASIGISLAYYYKKDKQNTRNYFDQAKQIKPVLNKGMEGLLDLEKEGFYYSVKKQETLKLMFDELK